MRWNRWAMLPVLAVVLGGLSRMPVAEAQGGMAAAAAPKSVQAVEAADAGRLGDKFAALAGAMAGKYDWRPMEGVRSVSDVFNLMLHENGMLTHALEGSAMQPGAKMEPINDPARMQDALKASYAALQKTIQGMSDSQMQQSIKLFGREMTRENALMMMLSDQHEHLGQSIAYARMNHVVPPWSRRH